MIQSLDKFVAKAPAMEGEGTVYGPTLQWIAKTAEEADHETIALILTDGGDEGWTNRDPAVTSAAVKKVGETETKVFVGPSRASDPGAHERLETIFKELDGVTLATEADFDANLTSFLNHLK